MSDKTKYTMIVYSSSVAPDRDWHRDYDRSECYVTMTDEIDDVIQTIFDIRNAEIIYKTDNPKDIVVLVDGYLVFDDRMNGDLEVMNWLDPTNDVHPDEDQICDQITVAVRKRMNDAAQEREHKAAQEKLKRYEESVRSKAEAELKRQRDELAEYERLKAKFEPK